MVKNCENAWRQNDVISKGERMVDLIGQKPSQNNTVKLNTDGACIDLNRAVCGGVIRNNRGNWIGGFAKHLDSCSAFVIDLWGVFNGLITLIGLDEIKWSSMTTLWQL